VLLLLLLLLLIKYGKSFLAVMDGVPPTAPQPDIYTKEQNCRTTAATAAAAAAGAIIQLA
jgi:hypothetical protein